MIVQETLGEEAPHPNSGEPELDQIAPEVGERRSGDANRIEFRTIAMTILISSAVFRM